MEIGGVFREMEFKMGGFERIFRFCYLYYIGRDEI